MKEYRTVTTDGKYQLIFETDDQNTFKQVETICRLLIDGKSGEAIPVEWIKQYGKRNPSQKIFLDIMLIVWEERK